MKFNQIVYILKCYFFLILCSSQWYYVCGMKRGPHHPKSEVSNSENRHHLTHQEHNIDDEMHQYNININPDSMTDEEKHFFYFKIHDNDKNNALDGLEMLHAAIHQENKSPNFDGDVYLQNSSNEIDHIIEVIDDFLAIADLDRDGYLNYAEYMKAINENKT